MANTIQLRRSATANAVPTTTQLALGELAINTYDGKLYLKKNVSGTETVVEVTNNQSLNTTSSPTFSKIILSTNGSGDNIAIGDDSYLGDVNQANTLRVMGQQDPTKGYIVFGNSDNGTALGRSGTGALTWGANTIYHSGNLPAGSTPTKITGMSLAAAAADDLVYGSMADNDQFRIRIGGTAANAGWAEIATADDGTEPIYVRQYTGVFTTIARTATLLDASGDTSFPGTITAGVDLVSNFSSGDEGGQIRLNKATTNTTLTTGISIDVYQNKLRIYETGGSSRGLSIDLTTAANTVGSRMVIANASNDIDILGGYLINPNLKSYTEHKVTNATTTGTVTLDLSTSNVFHNTLTGNTTFAFSNPPANTKVFSFTIIVTQDATGGRTITWPTSKKFAGGVTPPPTTAANAVDVWSVMTYDGGTSYIVSLSVKDAK